MLKRYLSIILALILSISCFSYVFSAEVSTGDRTVGLESYQVDGTYKNENDIDSGVYSLNLMKSTTLTNKVKLTYVVDSAATEADVPSKINVTIPNANIPQTTQLETSDIDVFGSEISVTPTTDNVTVSIPIIRNKLVEKDSVYIIIPFTLTKMVSSGDITVSLISSDDRTINYSWKVNLVEVSDTELTLPERLDANTKFTIEEIKANAGFKYILPLSLQSVSDEKEFTFKVSNQNFYFKGADGQWTKGEAAYVVNNLIAGKSNLQQIEVFCFEKPTDIFRVSVENTNLKTILPVFEDNQITLSSVGTDSILPTNTTGVLKLQFAYSEEYAANNIFKFKFANYDSDYYEIDQENAKISVDTEKHVATFEANYTPKKEYNNKELNVHITTEFGDEIYTLAEGSVLLTAVSSETEINDIGVNASLENNNTITLKTTNYSKDEKEVTVTINVDTDKILLDTDNNLVSSSSTTYMYNTSLAAGESDEKIITYNISEDCNESSETVYKAVTFSLPSDDNTGNNTSVVNVPVAGKLPEKGVDFSVDAFGDINSMGNGQTKETYVQITNHSDTTETAAVKVKVSNEHVLLESSVQSWNKVSDTEYQFTITVESGKTTKIPFAIVVPSDCNTSTENLPISIMASIISTDSNSTNNSKIAPILIIPDNKPEAGIDLNEYFDLSFDSTVVNRLEPVTVSLSASQKKPLSTELHNGSITLEVIGDVKEQAKSSNYSSTKNVATLDVSSINHSITFTPTNVGKYMILAYITCDDVSDSGTLRKAYTFTIDEDSGAYPNEPIISSDAITMSAELSDISDNKGTLTVKVKNNTVYILRDTYLNLDYSNAINLKYSGNIIRNDMFIGNLPPETEKTFIFDVEVLQTGKTEIAIACKSQDLNTDVFKPTAYCNKDVVYTTTPTIDKTYEISGSVFNDLNDNGVLNVTEEGLANVTVNLCGTVGNILKTTRTYSSGYYSFDDVKPGTYKIKVDYMGYTSEKTITVVEQNINSANIPIYIKSNGGDNDENGDVTPNPIEASISIYASIIETTKDYCIVEVTAKNNSNIATLVNLSMNTGDLSVHTLSDWHGGNGLYNTDYFLLNGFTSKTITIKVDRTDTNTPVYFNVNAISDNSPDDNSIVVTILAKENSEQINPPSISDDFWNGKFDAEDDGTSDKHTGGYKETIADFAPSAIENSNANNSSSQTTEPNDSTNTNHNTSSINGSYQSNPNGNMQNVVEQSPNYITPTLPKTGELHITSITTQLIVYLVAYIIGILSLCFAICRITQLKR